MEQPQDAHHYHLQMLHRTPQGPQPNYLLELITNLKYKKSIFILQMKMTRFQTVLLFARICASLKQMFVAAISAVA